MSEAEKLKKARKRIRLLNKQYRNMVDKHNEVVDLYHRIKSKYMQECQIRMEYDIRENQYVFFNYITKNVYRCVEEPRELGLGIL